MCRTRERREDKRICCADGVLQKTLPNITNDVLFVNIAACYIVDKPFFQYFSIFYQCVHFSTHH